MNSENYAKMSIEEKTQLRCYLCGNKATAVVKDGGSREVVCDECLEEFCTFNPIEEIL